MSCRITPYDGKPFLEREVDSMAKLEYRLDGAFDVILREIEEGILHGSVSASLEDKSDFRSGTVRCAVRVFERYSMAGGNRLSMTVTLFDSPEGMFLSAITAGGSNTRFIKINTFGENSFLRCIEEIVERFRV